MALKWVSSGVVSTDDRVSVSRTVCGPFRATVYAFEPYEDRFYFDIEYTTSSASLPYVMRSVGDSKTTGALNTSAKAQRAAALKLQSLASSMTATIGKVS